MINIFNVNFDTFIFQWLPVKLRKNTQIAWLKTLLAPIKILYSDFTNARKRNLLYAKTTPQVVYLENLLNSLFDPNLKGIKIVDGEEINATYVYTDNDPRGLIVYPEGHTDAAYIYNSEPSKWDFVVLIPSHLNLSDTDKLNLKNILNQFKLPVKTYLIK